MRLFIAEKPDLANAIVEASGGGARKDGYYNRGKPVPKRAPKVSELHNCKACGSGLSRRPGKKKVHFWRGSSNFPTRKQTYPDLNGRPDYSKGRHVTTTEGVKP